MYLLLAEYFNTTENIIELCVNKVAKDLKISKNEVLNVLNEEFKKPVKKVKTPIKENAALKKLLEMDWY